MPATVILHSPWNIEHSNVVCTESSSSDVTTALLFSALTDLQILRSTTEENMKPAYAAAPTTAVNSPNPLWSAFAWILWRSWTAQGCRATEMNGVSLFPNTLVVHTMKNGLLCFQCLVPSFCRYTWRFSFTTILHFCLHRLRSDGLYSSWLCDILPFRLRRLFPLSCCRFFSLWCFFRYFFRFWCFCFSCFILYNMMSILGKYNISLLCKMQHKNCT